MKKIFYIALALSVCTAGFGTAAQMASHSEILTLTTANDTITDQDEEEYIEEADDEFGEIPEEDEEIEEDAAADDEQPQAAAAEEAKDTIPADIELTEGMLIDVDTLMR